MPEANTAQRMCNKISQTWPATLQTRQAHRKEIFCVLHNPLGLRPSGGSNRDRSTTKLRLEEISKGALNSKIMFRRMFPALHFKPRQVETNSNCCKIYLLTNSLGEQFSRGEHKPFEKCKIN